MPPKLTFVHLSDSHIGPAQDFAYHQRRPLDDLERVIAAINAFPSPPDFVIHTGDIVHDQRAESFAFAAETLAALSVPLYAVCGNHDTPALVRQHLAAPALSGFEGNAAANPGRNPVQGTPDLNTRLDYAFEVKGERFLVLDSNSPAVPDPQGQLCVEQIAALRTETESDGPPLTVLIHHPPFRMASPWLDQHMIITNGDELHAALLPARDRLRGVFFGHLHRSCQIVRDGITYTGGASTTWQYAWQPWDDLPQVDAQYPPGFNLVHYLPGQVVALHYTL
ncbi:MAG: hypothetical protein GYB65_12590 [Chloroflexi bacterium]|nr:hypothetical protein [Chloroflexota bacterium]